ncbi:hypothetical protein ACSBR2_028355 [Camellia fascicularis]
MPLPKSPAHPFLILLPFLFLVQAKPPPPTSLQQNATNKPPSMSPSSPWLNRVTDPRAPGCGKRPWICEQEENPPPKFRMKCCQNRCIDVTSDINNCGLCGLRCPFTWQCCRGLCINTNINPFHCGRCDHRCTFRSLCFYGMCGYAAPLPEPPQHPFPFPPKPEPPRLPFPPKPEPPHHPFPPKPEPPHPPAKAVQLKS